MPFSSPNDTWMLPSHMFPVLPHQSPLAVHLIQRNSKSPKRMKELYPPRCQCTNRDIPHSCDTMHESRHMPSREVLQMHPSTCTNAGCTCSNHCATVFPPHHELVSMTGASSMEPPPYMQNMMDYRHKYNCSCCLDHRHLQWTSQVGHKVAKPPVY